MTTMEITREEMWARQQVILSDTDHKIWSKKKKWLHKMDASLPGYLFAVDVCQQNYAFASHRFADIFGYSLTDLKNIEDQGDLLEEKIHPDDREQMITMQINHSRFIYSLPPEERNNYQTLFQFRMQNAQGKYMNVTSRQQVLLTDRYKKAWIIMGIMDIAPDQTALQTVSHTVIHRISGSIIHPDPVPKNKDSLTKREKEILELIRQGWLSKEIAGKLHISIYTVHNHRKNILDKLQAGNAMEAVRIAISNDILR